VRTHGAEPALAREHRDRLGEWVRAARGALRTALGAEAASALIGFGLGAWLLSDFFARAAGTGSATDPGTALLAVFWALSLPTLGYELALLVQQVPAQRNLTLRLVEPLGAPEEESGPPSPDAAVETAAPASAVSIQLSEIRVVAAGHQI